MTEVVGPADLDAGLAEGTVEAPPAPVAVVVVVPDAAAR